MTAGNRAGRGRPVRFLLLLLLAWSASRAMLRVDFTTFGRPAAPAHAQFAAARADAPAAAPAPIRPAPIRPAIALRPPAPRTLAKRGRSASAGRVVDDAVRVDLMDFLDNALPFAGHSHGDPHDAQLGSGPLPPTPLPPVPDGRKWRMSGWMLWRDGSGPGADYAPSGRLGGSQAGMRLDVDLTSPGRGALRAYARASAALAHPAAPEGALGLAYQPARHVPVSLAVERRIALGSGARDAMAFVAAGGFGPMALSPAIEAEGYVQIGFVGLRAADRFLDGKISAFALKPTDRLRLGASLSGGAQPHLSRLDIGPEMQVRLPSAPLASRLSVEWRMRVAGNAAPGSGLAVTLGADF